MRNRKEKMIENMGGERDEMKLVSGFEVKAGFLVEKLEKFL